MLPEIVSGHASRKTRCSTRRPGHELQRQRVHAVTQTGRTWAVVEDVAEVALATRAAHFGAQHAETGVAEFDHIVPGNRLPEARPARAGIEFGGVVVQRRGATRAAIKAARRWTFVLSAESGLGAAAAQDFERGRRQPSVPLGVAEHQPRQVPRTEIAAVVREDFQQHAARLGMD